MLNNFLLFFFKLVEISVFGYFFYVSIYNFILSIAGCFNQKKINSNNNILHKIGIYIPAYKEDNVIIHTAKAATNVKYPLNLYDVIVIADSLKVETLEKLKKLPIRTIEVSFAQSTKVKALESALNKTQNSFDFFVILDADNLMKHDFLQEANRMYNAGKKIVQGRRIAKNQDYAIEILDDISEQINNHVNRKGSNILGGSSSIAGSGFLIDQKIGHEVFHSIDSVGGFDKELELVLLKQNIKTHYCDSMIVYDEKIRNTSTFKSQRKRWISSQYIYLFKYFRSGIKELLLNGNFAYFNSAILRNIQLPRLLNLGLFTCLCIIIIPFIKILTINYLIWLFVYLLFLCSVFISVPRVHYNRKTLFSILKIPGVFMTMFLLLFQLRGSDKSFIHTPHNIDKSFDNEF